MPAKRVPSAALALLLVVSFAAPSGARALTQYGFTYTQSGGAVTVTGCDGACPTAIDIPAVFGGYFVTAIGEGAFDRENLVAVSIPSTVTNIGLDAFWGNDLTAVTIPNSVTYLGEGSFSGNNITALTIPTSVTSISAGAFAYNPLIALSIPNSVTSIGAYSFYDGALTTLTIGNSVTIIGSNAFAYNDLTSVAIPASVTTIGDGVFAGNSLSAVTIPTSVTSISDSAFADNALTTVTIPNSVTSIGHSAFFNNLLTTVTIPNSVTSIGDSAFDSNRLTSVTFLGNAPLAGNDVFLFNGGLTSVTRPYTATGWGSTWSGVPVVIADARATATVRPTVAGTATVGRTLTTRGTWTGYPTPTLTYQWYACTRAVTAARTTVPSTCKRITGATRSTFKLTAAQRGKFVTVLVKGTSVRTATTTWLAKTTAKIR